jgi:hypothetical protein
MVFAPLRINDANTANKLIKEGLYIDQHLVRVKKDKEEPIHPRMELEKTETNSLKGVHLVNHTLVLQS